MVLGNLQMCNIYVGGEQGRRAGSKGQQLFQTGKEARVR